MKMAKEEGLDNFDEETNSEKQGEAKDTAAQGGDEEIEEVVEKKERW
jgi:hypothetical protein